ncbi:cytochrome C [Massilia glaciei]|uniref:Cytochrome C n=2 Tax=Massilia glaciei TaxID=1524097 RepID=A0A2U2HNT7_9BURK|nr:cytochrome C [Massilia glaciei]
MASAVRLAALALACALGAPHAQAQRPAVLPDTMAQRVLACTACHAPKPKGDDAFFPRIAGKPADYLYNQLVNFREGRRQYPLMSYMVQHLSDDYLREIALHFSQQHIAPPAPQHADSAPAVFERGRVLATRGDAALKVPACIACHGEKLTGVAPAIPGLLGLPRDYVNAQLGAWRNKTRRAHAPDCMADIAARMSAADIDAVSRWLAVQTPPADTHPATAIARPLPSACGSSPD